MHRSAVIGLGGVLLLCLSPSSGQAVSPSRVLNATGDFHAASTVKNIANSRCVRKNGQHVCRPAQRKNRQVRGASEYPQYGKQRPEDLPTGSSAWWKAMDDERRGGFGGDN